MNIEQLENEYERLATEARTLQSRGVDATTLHAAIDRATAAKKRWSDARSAERQQAEINRLTGGMMVGGSGRLHSIEQTDFGKFLAEHRGRLTRTGPLWTTPPLDLIGFGGGGAIMAATTLDESAGSGGGLVLPDVIPGIHPMPTRELVVADLMAPGTTTSNSVAFMRETAIDNQAAAVGEGGLKPQSSITFEQATAPVKKIATWIETSEEILEDVEGFPDYLNTRLRHFVLLEEDRQLLAGDGLGANFTGILHLPGLAAPIARVDPENNADAILRQISAIETATQMPVSGVVLNPDNWNAVLLLKDTTGNYIAGGGPFGNGLAKTLWGRAVAVTPVQPTGTATVGAFKTGSTLRRRTPVRILASNSHADFFIRNKIALVGEERAALVIYREAAFGAVTNLAASTPPAGGARKAA